MSWNFVRPYLISQLPNRFIVMEFRIAHDFTNEIYVMDELDFATFEFKIKGASQY